MTRNRNAILALCSRLCMDGDDRPLSLGEYSGLENVLNTAGKTPGDLFELTADAYGTALGLRPEQTGRILRLLDRSEALRLALESYARLGIRAVTRAEPEYPRVLIKKLGPAAPPLLFYAGNISLLQQQLVGYVGTRDITPQDLSFTTGCVRKTVEKGYGVVSGGARGVDTVAATEALRCGGVAVEYLAEALEKKLKNRDVIQNVQQGRMLMLSVANPDTGFRTGIAMMRNRYIYAQSEATVVIRANLGKGGTWSGACDNLKNGWSPTLCRAYPYPGNEALLQKGAIPIDEAWDGSLPQKNTSAILKETYTQTSLFESP